MWFLRLIFGLAHLQAACGPAWPAVRILLLLIGYGGLLAGVIWLMHLL